MERRISSFWGSLLTGAARSGRTGQTRTTPPTLSGSGGAPPLSDPAFGSMPVGTDWYWRPALWQLPLAQAVLSGIADRARIGDEVAVFHDDPQGDITLSQVGTTDAGTAAPFGISLDLARFAGSFVSLAIDLPPGARLGLRKRHILRAGIGVTCLNPCAMFARLNIRHGPNIARIAQTIAPDRPVAEFDLATTDLDERRADLLWLDLIAERPAVNRISIADVTLARFPRGEF